MLRSAVTMAGAAVLMVGVAACAAPGTAASRASSIPSSGVVSSAPVSSSAPIESAPAGSPVASAPAKPLKLVGSPPQDVGDLEQFTQASATIWWATVVGNLSDRLYLVRTVDRGQHWQDVTPTVTELHANGGMSSYVLSADIAWLDVDAKPTTPQLFRTLDAGQSWQQMGTVPDGCALQFVDSQHGWCSTLDGAAGSMTVEVYVTQDGGATWQLISKTTGDGTLDTPDALPFGCDKSLTFTSQAVGWAASFCAGGGPYLDTSTDGGAHWHAVTPPPFPATADSSEGEGLSVPVASGDDVAIADLGGLGPGASAIDTSSDDGRSWRTHALPIPASGRYWNVDLIDPTHWRATDGDVIMSTDDAGAHWQRWTPAISMHDQFGVLDLDFISPEVGTASDPADRTPMWSTTDGGKTWTKVVIDAGPYMLN